MFSTSWPRICIVGTFGTWTQTPWQDQGLKIVGLNDAWTLGFQRQDAWFELHPLSKLHFRPLHKRVMYAHEVKPGYYVRPEGHLEKLQSFAQTMPVFLQSDPPKGWPALAQRFPIEAIMAQYGPYWASGPSYEIAWAMAQGCTELWITGIHLATSHEYREQRPNFEALLGRFLGPRVKEVVRDQLRYIEGPDHGVLLVLPESCPILAHGWQYGYEPKPQPPYEPAAQVLREAQQQQMTLMNKLAHWPRWKDKAPHLDRWRRLEARAQDAKMMLDRGRIPAAALHVEL